VRRVGDCVNIREQVGKHAHPTRCASVQVGKHAQPTRCASVQVGKHAHPSRAVNIIHGHCEIFGEGVYLICMGIKCDGRMLMPALMLATLFCSGCAQGVYSEDKLRLWNAAMVTTDQMGFTVKNQNYDRGYIFGERTLTGSNNISQTQELSVRFNITDDGYRAFAIIRRVPMESQYPILDIAQREDRIKRVGPTPNMTEYGSVATRDGQLESEFNDRMKANLALQPATAAPPPPPTLADE
jgi:hypothetical protein